MRLFLDAGDFIMWHVHSAIFEHLDVMFRVVKLLLCAFYYYFIYLNSFLILLLLFRHVFKQPTITWNFKKAYYYYYYFWDYYYYYCFPILITFIIIIELKKQHITK